MDVIDTDKQRSLGWRVDSSKAQLHWDKLINVGKAIRTLRIIIVTVSLNEE